MVTSAQVEPVMFGLVGSSTRFLGNSVSVFACTSSRHETKCNRCHYHREHELDIPSQRPRHPSSLQILLFCEASCFLLWAYFAVSIHHYRWWLASTGSLWLVQDFPVDKTKECSSSGRKTVEPVRKHLRAYIPWWEGKLRQGMKITVAFNRVAEYVCTAFGRGIWGCIGRHWTSKLFKFFNTRPGESLPL